MYSLGIRIERVERRKANTGLLHVASGLLMLVKSADLLRYLQYKNFLPVIPFLFTGLILLLYGAWRKRWDPREKWNGLMHVLAFVSFAVLGVLMVYHGRALDYTILFVWAILSLGLWFTEMKLRKPLQMELTDEHILIPGFYRDYRIPWQALRSIVIKPDFVTIFRENGKYLQYEITDNLDTQQLAAMQQFCEAALSKRGVSSSD